MDLFEKLKHRAGPLGRYAKQGEGYYFFPKLEGELDAHMTFRGKKRLVWSLNNYLGLANHPEVRQVDAEAAKDWGLAYPMGARMMSGNTSQHEELEEKLAKFVGKQSSILLNYGYQGIMSTIAALVDRHDVIVYDSECHACIIDGLMMHQGKRFVYQHNNMESLEKRLQQAELLLKKQKETFGYDGCVLVITEGVFGMSGVQGNLKSIVELKKKYEFRVLVDDAHGFGAMGATGAGAAEAQGVQKEIDIYFSTFAKAMASIGAFAAADEAVIEFLRYNTRSQIFAKALPMPLVVGAIKRLELLQTRPELRQKLWHIVGLLQNGLRERGFNLGNTTSPVTPVILSGTVEQSTNLVLDLRENYDIFCSVVVYPVVPKDVILLRLIPTAIHSEADVAHTLNAFTDVKDKLSRGEYDQNTFATF